MGDPYSGGGSFGGSGLGVSKDTFNLAGGAASDLFASEGYKAKAAGLRIEAENYRAAGAFSLKNKQFAETTTALEESQAQRKAFQVIGGQQADVAASGFGAAGDALDLLRSSTQQAALQKAVLGQQGLIKEEGYQVQSDAYTNMAKAADIAAEAAEKAGKFAQVTGVIKAVGAVATL